MISRKAIILSVFTASALTLTGVAYSLPGLGGTQTYGPWSCTSCTVASPMPDAASRAYIQSRLTSYQQGYTFFKFAPGDKIVVCNAQACTTYEVTDTRDYLGVKQEPIIKVPTRGGGGGGGAPVYGGGPGAPGCIAGCNPTVTVGDPTNPDKKKDK